MNLLKNVFWILVGGCYMKAICCIGINFGFRFWVFAQLLTLEFRSLKLLKFFNFVKHLGTCWSLLKLRIAAQQDQLLPYAYIP
eukprot:TRINITY_DN3504_c0_g1_i1.p2 TRINITY_DN3504_c0_g1~~TRINITY_DN3504_c0_g1_i1.p2  ORF type:complete len:83 (+),score=7.58 TRINITY_DN3504_c0_g1_i1:384-632(+)